MKSSLPLLLVAVLLAGCATSTPVADRVIVLHARTATVHGKMLRFEPEPHKNTLGYWTNPADWAEWTFLAPAGRYAVEVLQGCGKGQGGSEVAVTVAGQTLKFTVEDTGHFQNFKPRVIGQVTLAKAGEQVATVKPLNKAAAAVMDLRQMRLLPLNADGTVRVTE